MSDLIVSSIYGLSAPPASGPTAGILSPEQIEAAVDILKQGGLVAFPTETVYGLGADAENPVAMDRLYTVKGRPKGHPVIVHLASIQQLEAWAEDIPLAAWQLAEIFWPGPLTLILKRAARVPDAVTGGQETVGIRVPAHPGALQLLQAFGGGLAAPSANRFGRLSPTRAAHVQADLGQDVDLILEGGECPVGVESTIVAFRDGLPVILRPGMITAEQIEAVLSANPGPPKLNSIFQDVTQTPGATVIRAPGTLASHYAPRTPLRLIASEQLIAKVQWDWPADQPLGVLARQEKPSQWADRVNLIWVNLEDEPEAYARQLYAQLRELDQRHLVEIWGETVPEHGAWAAVSDRLQRAAYSG
jgi:L-threonylcarbamoyladenylate synthase